jgi:hypothetical protein
MRTDEVMVRVNQQMLMLVSRWSLETASGEDEVHAPPLAQTGRPSAQTFRALTTDQGAGASSSFSSSHAWA